MYMTWCLNQPPFPARIQIIEFQNATNYHIKVLDIGSFDPFRLWFQNILITIFVVIFFRDNCM